MKLRADELLTKKRMARTRSQAANFIRMGKVFVGQTPITKPGELIDETSDVRPFFRGNDCIRGRGTALPRSPMDLHVNFKGESSFLDVGSSTGGFTDFALQHGAKKVIAVDVGSKQLHPSLRRHPRIELHERTDIRDVRLRRTGQGAQSTEQRVHIDVPDVIVVDVSFISLREVLPHCSKLMTHNTQLVAMVKPQFEAQKTGVKHKGVIKNKAMRRDVLKDFQSWAKNVFTIQDKADSEVTGSKGNVERFYLLKKTS
ncbi:MAG: SAM-dependent methyltransferase [Candidatus Saccharibacteria bacterium]|nr:SAM-dependent methyltransferase [Candidatus Saccharibacteria bacterium]